MGGNFHLFCIDSLAPCYTKIRSAAKEGANVKDPLEFAEQAHYIGSLPKDDEMCDFYEIVVDGQRRYVYIKADPVED